MKYLEIESFPNCCGARVLHSFGYSEDDGRTPAEYYINGIVRDIVEAQDLCRRRGFLVAALNAHQKRFFHASLVKCGFKLSAKGRNSQNTGAMVYCYTYSCQ